MTQTKIFWNTGGGIITGCILAIALTFAMLFLGRRIAGNRILKAADSGSGRDAKRGPGILPVSVPSLIGIILLLIFTGMAGEDIGAFTAASGAAALIASCVVSFPVMLGGIERGYAATSLEEIETAGTLGMDREMILRQLLRGRAKKSTVMAAVLSLTRFLAEYFPTIAAAKALYQVRGTVPAKLSSIIRSRDYLVSLLFAIILGAGIAALTLLVGRTTDRKRTHVTRSKDTKKTK